MSVIDQILKHVDQTQTCWLWTGCQDQRGYGMVRIGGGHGKTMRSHRALWEAINGPVPEGLELDHLCRVRHCVNPAHLEPVTPRENSLRGNTIARLRSEQSHCIHGHLLAGDNLLMVSKRGGEKRYRQCRLCAKTRIQAWKRQRKGR